MLDTIGLINMIVMLHEFISYIGYYKGCPLDILYHDHLSLDFLKSISSDIIAT